MNNNRSIIIESLLKFAEPLDELQRQLNCFDWDFEGIPIVLCPDHIVNVLEHYIGGELPASGVERWANMIEGREDVSYDSGHEKWIADTIHELANPVLTTPLSPTRANELITSVGG